MLKLKYLFENFELAKELLALYDCDAASLDEMLEYYRISSNAVYPFRKGSDPKKVCFLRFSPVEEKSIADVASEVRLIQWLVDQGYPAMKPVPMHNGKYTDVITTKWGSYNVSCFEEVPGDSLEDCEGSLALVRGYGKSLGMLHALLKTYPFSNERRDHQALLCEVRDRLIRYGAPTYMLDECDAVEKALSALPKTPDNYGMIHYDFEPDNVFYDEKTGVYSAIDFDDAIRCWYTLDIVRALDALDDVVDEALLEQAEDELLSGYREACSLSEANAQTLPLMRRFVLLKKYSTLLHVLSEPTKEEPDWLIEVKDKLNRRIAWVESVVRGEDA